MKKIILLTLILSVQAIYSQFTLKGNINDKYNQPLMGVTISIESETKGAVTDFDGYYEIHNINSNSITVKISYIGYQPIVKTISFTNNQEVLDAIMTESEEYLQEVEITGTKTVSYRNKVSYSATRLAIPVKETAMAVNSVTKELINDLNLTRLDDIIKNVPGVVSSNGLEDFKYRGFRSPDYILYNGSKVQKSYWSPIKIPNIERVEMLMGGSSSLYGNASPGGSMNLVTKKPLENSRNYLKFTAGSFETHRIDGDFTGPLDDNKQILYRLNMSYERSNGQLKFGNSDNFFIAPSVTFRPNDKTNVNVEITIDKFNGIVNQGTPVVNFDLEQTPTDFTVTQPSDYSKNVETKFNVTINHKFNDKLSLVASYLSSSYITDLSRHTIWDTPSEGQFTIRYYKWDVRSNSQSFSTYLRLKLHDNKDYVFNGILGLDTYKENYDSSYLASIGEGDGVESFYSENPVYEIRYPSRYKRSITSNNFGEDVATQNTIGVYLQGHFRLIDKLNIVLNARIEDYKGSRGKGTEEERKTTEVIFLPRVAINYSLNDIINVYANFNIGFEPVPNYFQPKEGEEGGFDKPMTSINYELGTKASFFNNRLATSISAYYIPRENVVVHSKAEKANYIQIDEISRGIEVSANGRIKSNWNLSMSYTYNYIEVSRDPEEGLLNGAGQVINNEDKQEVGSPFFLASLFSKYRITQGSFKGVAFGIGGNYVSERRSSFVGFRYPEYVVANASVYYNIGNYSMSFVANNIFDKKYVQSGYGTELYLGKIRNYNFSVGYRF